MQDRNMSFDPVRSLDAASIRYGKSIEEREKREQMANNRGTLTSRQ